MENLQEKDLKFSVLMPVYIHEKDDELRLAIDSIINQTLMPNEILIIADKDIPQNTKDILDEYKLKYPEIFNPVILEEPANLGKALQIGVNLAKNPIIARMDADDIADKYRFEKQITYFKQHPELDLVGSWITEFEGKPENIYAKRELPIEQDKIYSFCKFRNPINHMTAMYKKDSVLKAGNYTARKRMEDYHLWAMMLYQGCKFANIPEYLVNARAGRDLIKRRSGLGEFFQYEFTLFKEFYDWGFINFREFFKAVSTKFLLRAIPGWLRAFIYNNFLHKKAESGVNI